MSKTQRDLEHLALITDTALSAAQARVQRLNTQEEGFRRQLRELEQKRTGQADLASPAVQAGADVRWQVWVDARRESINIEIARIRASKENARHQLRIAFGKNQAIQQLIQKQRKLAALKQSRQLS